MTKRTLTDRHTTWLVITLLALFPLVGMGVDLIAPSLPAISISLHVSHQFAKNLISLYLVGYAIGSLCLGFLSDALGRKPLMIAGLASFVLVSLLAPLFPQPWVLLAVRFMQGMSVAAIAVLSRAIVADILPLERLMRTGAMMATMWGLGPIIGPFFGGYLQTFWGWQACFYFFAAFAAIGFILLVKTLPETHHIRQPLQVRQIGRNIATIVSHRIFLGTVIIMGSFYAMLIAFNTLGPFIIQTVLHHTPIYFGHIALLMGVMFLLGTLICRRLIKTITPERIFKAASPVVLGLVILALIAAWGWPLNLPLLLVITLLLFLSCGTIYSAGIGKCLSLFRHLAGSTAAMMNFIINVVFTSVTAAILSFVNVTSIVPLMVTYLLLMLLVFLSNIFLVQRHANKTR